MRYATDLFYPFVRGKFLDRKYGWPQKCVCHILYAIMTVGFRAREPGRFPFSGRK